MSARDDLRRALVDLRVAFDDADAVTADVLRPLRRRELGAVLHRQNYRDAKVKVLAAHAAAMRLLGDDAAPDGGAPPTH